MPVNAALKAYLETRRSIPAFQMGEPGPSRAEIEEMLTLASRVPDHGKLAPWRFIVYSGAERERLSLELAKVAMAGKPDMADDMIKVEKTRLTRAPVVIAVVSRAAPHVKIPEWEQVMSAGAVCLNLLIAANALGYCSNWLTEWYAFDQSVYPLLGVESHERIAGFIHIGTEKLHPGRAAAAPALSHIVTLSPGGVSPRVLRDQRQCAGLPARSVQGHRVTAADRLDRHARQGRDQSIWRRTPYFNAISDHPKTVMFASLRTQGQSAQCGRDRRLFTTSMVSRALAEKMNLVLDRRTPWREASFEIAGLAMARGTPGQCALCPPQPMPRWNAG